MNLANALVRCKKDLDQAEADLDQARWDLEDAAVAGLAVAVMLAWWARRR